MPQEVLGYLEVVIKYLKDITEGKVLRLFTRTDCRSTLDLDRR